MSLIYEKRVQFPELANDIYFPKLYEDEKYFSSVFRISSPYTRLWTHYDVIIKLINFDLIII